ncbi:hypothetical protein GF337_15085 [candidate division KSB1 bacterium]|nr:hypothetical protein [candidate division KSB1 bacterium]
MKKLVIAVVFFLILAELKAQVIFFPADSAVFQCDDIDSLFIFTREFGVTAHGNGIKRLRYEGGRITAQNIPPSLKVRNPVAAILYSHRKPLPEIPAILGRLDTQISLDRLLRHYLFGLNKFRGTSEQGEVKINVWQPAEKSSVFLIFLENGKIHTNRMPRKSAYQPANLVSLTLDIFHENMDSIAGVWVSPPSTGNNFLAGKILSLLEHAPLLVEFWDGFGWEMLEKAFLSGTIDPDGAEVQMAYSIFPPETQTNYAAKITDGCISTAAELNIFTALHSAGIDYAVLEGERLPFSIPGNVKLHTADSSEEKDERIFQSLLAVIESDTIPFIFAHYHGLDDLSHAYGPDDPRTVDHLKQLWKWHLQLRESWHGTMLIISDHGSHAVANDDKLNIKFVDKGTKGTHGDFRFSDMAVPLISRTGQKQQIISREKIEIARNLLFGAIPQANDATKDLSQLIFVFDDSSDTLDAQNDAQKFDQTFSFSYLKKGNAFEGEIQGRLLKEWLPVSMKGKIDQIIVRSYDGNQIAFSARDLEKNTLVLALEREPEYSFTLYPLKDRFPNRMVKWVGSIEIHE